MKKALKAISLAVMVLMVFGNAFGQGKLTPFEENGKYGYKDESGKMIIEAQYYYASDFSEGLAAVHAEAGYVGTWGYINEKGNMVIQPQFNWAGSFSEGLARVRVGEIINEIWGYINKKGEMVIQPQFDDARDFSADIASVRIGNYSEGRWGCIDKKGKMVIQPTYEDAPIFMNGLVALIEDNGKKELINNKGKKIVEFPSDAYVSIYDFEHGWGRVQVNDKYGLADENGWVKEPQFDAVNIVGAMAFVTKDDNNGLMKKNGQWFIEPKIKDSLCDVKYSEGIICVKEGSKYGYISESDWLVKPQYYNAELFSEGLAAVKTDESWDGKWGYIDKTGKMCIEPQFKSTVTMYFTDGLAMVRDEDDKYGFIDKKGNWVIQPQFDGARLFYEDMAAVEVDGKWGYINKSGKVVINMQYENVSYFSKGLAGVEVDGKWGFIDKTGKMVVQPKYDFVYEFTSSGKARIRIGDWDNGQWGYVDRNGNFTPDEE